MLSITLVPQPHNGYSIGHKTKPRIATSQKATQNCCTCLRRRKTAHQVTDRQQQSTKVLQVTLRMIFWYHRRSTWRENFKSGDGIVQEDAEWWVYNDDDDYDNDDNGNNERYRRAGRWGEIHLTLIGLYSSRCVHVTNLLKWTVFTQHTNDSCKSTTG